MKLTPTRSITTVCLYLTLQLENLSFIEKNSGAKITFNAKWTGIQDGLQFKIRDEEITAVKEAEYLLRQLLQSVS